MNGSLHGAGVGARGPHLDALRARTAASPDAPSWLELLADNHLDPVSARVASSLARRYPVAVHAVGMNLGGVDPVDARYLDRLAALIDLVDPVHVSDHVAFTALDGVHHHDLWPLPHTREVALHVAARVREVQERLGRRVLVENISTYARHAEDDLTEDAFLTTIVEAAGCGLVLDLNNLWVNQHNHGEDALEVLRRLPLDRVGYVHLAGHTRSGDLLIDTHDAPVCDAVWGLYSELQRLAPGTPALIEWDDDLPTFDVMVDHVQRAEALTLAPSAAQVSA